jgi:hypothetical protein
MYDAMIRFRQIFKVNTAISLIFYEEIKTGNRFGDNFTHFTRSRKHTDIFLTYFFSFLITTYAIILLKTELMSKQ